MQTLEAVAKRKSTRNFDPNKSVSDDVIDTIIKSGCQAPIGGNKRDSLHLTVCRNRDILNEINQATSTAFKIDARDFFYGAPVVIFVSASEEQMAPSIEFANTACVIENMLIAATDAGVDSIYLWSSAQVLSKNKELCTKMGIPEEFKPVSAAAIGYSLSGDAESRELSVSLSINYI